MRRIGKLSLGPELATEIREAGGRARVIVADVAAISAIVTELKVAVLNFGASTPKNTSWYQRKDILSQRVIEALSLKE